MHGEDGGRGASQSIGLHHFKVSVSVCFCSPCILCLLSCSPLLPVFLSFLHPPLLSLSHRERSRTERQAGNRKEKKERRESVRRTKATGPKAQKWKEKKVRSLVSILSESLFLFAFVLLACCVFSLALPCFLSSSLFCALPCSH